VVLKMIFPADGFICVVDIWFHTFYWWLLLITCWMRMQECLKRKRTG